MTQQGRQQHASDAVRVVQKIPTDALSSIAKRLIRRLGKEEELLTAEEEQQACGTLKLTAEELQTLVEFSAYVFEQGAYQMQQPEQFEKNLVSQGIAKAHAGALRSVWEAEATAYVGRLRDQHIIGANVLTDTTWTTHLCVAKSNGDSTKTDATAIIEFHFGDEKPASKDDDTTQRPKDDTLAVECSHSELFTLFQKLQDIQRTIDRLSS